MLQALLKGKLSQEQENLEDLLTSSVFGLLAYLPAERGLIPLLRLARYKDDTTLDLLQAKSLLVKSVDFWPTHRADGVGSTEPDVVVELEDEDAQRHSLLIEVKLWSGKSSHPSSDSYEVRDQLAREWCVLIAHCQREESVPHLLYVTAATRYPTQEISEATDEFTSKRPALASHFPLYCAWFSWTSVETTFRSSAEPVLRDIAGLCRRLDLVPFSGIPTHWPPTANWRFFRSSVHFSFSVSSLRVKWRYI